MDSIKLARDLADQISLAMRSTGISVNQASQKTGIPRTTLIRRLSKPEFYPFNIAEVQRIAELTGTTATKLITSAERNQK